MAHILTTLRNMCDSIGIHIPLGDQIFYVKKDPKNRCKKKRLLCLSQFI
jgi:hypothetical protein